MKGRKVGRNGRSDGQAQHVRLYHWLLKSPAWKSLSPVARALYVVLSGHYSGTNNGEFFLSVRNAAKQLNVGKGAVSRAFHDLEERGFIKPRQRGAFDWKQRFATRWVLTEHPFADALPTKEFMSWKPSDNQSTVPLQVQPVPAEIQMGSVAM